MALPADELFESEEEFELWDDEIVVKGQPAAWHEAIRAKVISELVSQLPPSLLVVVSSAVGDDHTAPRSDGSVVEPAEEPPATLVWVEVVSPSDLRRGDARLLGERRRRFLFDHGVQNLWVVAELLGTVTLTAQAAGHAPEAFASPATVTLSVTAAGTEHRVTIDLGALEDVGRRAGDA